MCGVFGTASRVGERPSIDAAAAARLRDGLSHRGPDGSGLWAHQNVVMTHRRLAVVDPSPAGAQPMVLSPGGVVSNALAGDAPPRWALVYNGELYNEAEVRTELARLGVRFVTRSDTETLLQAWATWGTEALRRVRGMFAFAVYDTRLNTLTLARDPLGIKSIYYWNDGNEVVFASEPRAVTAHPRVGARPDLAMVSAYLTTIRTVLGERTMFEGVRAVRAGEMVQFDLGGAAILSRSVAFWRGGSPSEDVTIEQACDEVRAHVTESVTRHLRSDVPLCSLLSGGLDSTIIATLARREHQGLRTYCAGAPLPSECRKQENEGDLGWARRVAAEIGTDHAEAHLSREMFTERWCWMVGAMGMPLSTPNEVAIWTVADRLRRDGCVVTLSGEGADELFAGYEGPMRSALGAVRGARDHDISRHAMNELYASAWINAEVKQTVLNPVVTEATGNDAWLHGFYEREFGAAMEESGDDAMSAHLKMQRRINLTGLLQRLDTATMLAGVEGRTPIADVRIAELAESLPMAMKFSIDGEEDSGGVAVATRVRTKIALREAFRGVVSDEVIDRPKASFPLPFQAWMADMSPALRDSAFAREVFTDTAVVAVASQPEKLWNLAWPMMNVAVWGDAQGW